MNRETPTNLNLVLESDRLGNSDTVLGDLGS
jgi:hypothetical protein